MLRRLLGLIGLASVAAVAMAGPQTYSQRVQNIRCGVVILDSAIPNSGTQTTQPVSAAPFALYNLDSNSSLKPAGWNFYNPYAPSRVSPSIYSRWFAIDGTNTPVVGTNISKRNAPYWEVFLSQVTDAVLANYDMLLVNPSTYAALTPLEHERLRRFVDNGGLLWIDVAGLTSGYLDNAPFGGGYGNIDQFNNFPLPFLPVLAPAGTNAQTDFYNALMNSVLSLTSNDINVLDFSAAPTYTLQAPNLALDGGTNVLGIAGGVNDVNGTGDYAKLLGVSFIGNFPTISVGKIGEGTIVVTGCGTSLELNRSTETNYYLGTSANTHYAALDPYLGQDGLAAAKLAINMVGLLRESRQQAASSRKVSSSAIDLNPPLLSRSTIAGGYAGTLTNHGVSNSTPALYKGLIVTTTNGYVQVYDANPIVDLDGDGNPDDGIQDYSYGAPYDMVWQSSQLTAPLSAPVCAEVPGSYPGQVQDVVLVVDGAGNLNIFNLMPRLNGILLGIAPVGPTYTVAPPNGAPIVDSGVTGVPIAPTVHEGIAYVVDTVSKALNGNAGRIWQVNLQTGAPVTSTSPTGGPFVLGGTTTGVSLPEFSYSATVGYIPINDNSGGVDKVLYIPFAPNTGLGVAAAGISSIWLGAKGEVPTSYEPTAGNTASALTVTTRANTHGQTLGNQGLPIYTGTVGGLGVKLTVLDANGVPWTDKQMAAYFTGPPLDESENGILTFQFATGVTSLPANITGIRVDYTIDWAAANGGTITSSPERGRVLLPDLNPTPTRIINGAVALSPMGTAYVVGSNMPSGSATGTPGVGGGLYGFREQGFGQFTCISRYELFGANSIVLNQTENIAAPSVVTDNDQYLLQQYPFLQSNMSNFEIRGGPSIRNGQVFVTAFAQKSNPTSPAIKIPVTILMAFNAEPQTPTFIVGALSTGFQIEQPDFAKSVSQTSPENMSVIGQANSSSSSGYSYDSTTGVISFPNLMTNSNGQMQNALSLSQPIIVHQTGSPDQLIYPDAVGGSVWNPLQWFYVIDGAYPSGGAPLVTGNSVFVSCDSFLPGLLAGSTSFQTNGVLYAFNAAIGTSSLHPSSVHPWVNQLWTFDAASPLTPDPNLIWPQISSVTSFADFQLKVDQTVLGGSSANPSTVAFGVAGGDNALAAWGDTGLFTFAKANFLICDEGRIVEMDPSGNPIWTTDSSASAGQSSINASGNVKPLVRPVKAYHLTDTSILFADAGANRVATVGTNGVETRSISGFILDPGNASTGASPIIPDGYSAGEALTLSGPRDALYYTDYAQATAGAGVTDVPNGGARLTLGDNEPGTYQYEYWQHYLIADAGNHRLVEVVDRFYYNPTTQQIGQPVTINNVPQVGVLLWHSPATVSGKNYAYTSISRVLMPSTTAPPGYWVYVAGVGGTFTSGTGAGANPPTNTSLADAHDGNGGIVIFDPTTTAGVVTFNSITLPNVSNTNFWDPNTGQFDTQLNTTTGIGAETSVRRQGGLHRITNLNSVTAKIVSTSGPPYSASNAIVAIMIADSTGVYEVPYTPSPTPGQLGSLGSVDWMMPNEVFTALQQTTVNNQPVQAGTNAVALRALFARRLDSGDVMIVNGYYGNTVGGGVFTGEVMQVNGTSNYVGSTNFGLTNLGFGPASITLDLRTAGSTGARGLVMPVFADRR